MALLSGNENRTNNRSVSFPFSLFLFFSTTIASRHYYADFPSRRSLAERNRSREFFTSPSSVNAYPYKATLDRILFSPLSRLPREIVITQRAPRFTVVKIPGFFLLVSARWLQPTLLHAATPRMQRSEQLLSFFFFFFCF